MGYFPFFVDLEQKEGLIVGGGMTALRKIQKLLPYGPRLTVVSPVFHREIEQFPGLKLLRQSFDPVLLERQFFVVAATDDTSLNLRVADLCQQRRILVNIVDNQDACAFLFPALVKRGELSIGISTSGASPSAAIWLKEQIEDLMPNNIEEILDFLKIQRSTVQTMFPEEAQRSAVLKALCRACKECRRPLDQTETEELLSCFLKGDLR